MKCFTELLNESAAAHGHLCPGQVVGVRMAMLGCRLIGLDEPTRRDQIKKLIVYVEMDRCTADAVAHVTGVKLGRRTLKFMDYGIMACHLRESGNRQSRFGCCPPRRPAAWHRYMHRMWKENRPNSWPPTSGCPTACSSGFRR